VDSKKRLKDMANFELVMPKLGESIEEATITKWFVKAGDKIKDEDILLEIATDKVDSEIPSPVSGTVTKILYQQDETVAVGSVIAIIDTSGADLQPEIGAEKFDEAQKRDMEESQIKTAEEAPEDSTEAPEDSTEAPEDSAEVSEDSAEPPEDSAEAPEDKYSSESAGRYYSPLVRKIAFEENVSMAQLVSIIGTGRNGRVRKEDLLKYLEQRDHGEAAVESKPGKIEEEPTTPSAKLSPEKPKVALSSDRGDEIIQMDRMRKLIAEHMVMSKSVSAHVTNMIEADVTNIVLWRNMIKEEFLNREKEKITYLPVFLESVISALKDYPMINASVDGDKIILRKNINLGIAVALPSGNLIVPVIKNADQLNLLGLIKSLNKLADAARNNKLNPDDIKGGTFTISNFGTFRNVMGTPIINQPQVAILGIGTVEKKPAVLESPTGDMIAIRYKMFLSLTYDHRIIDGSYGGAFLRKLTDYLEAFDSNRVL
jgi:2-oxoglutarate dehydrogenase E2 component (dihydrolipoamide succinyltransferase)